MASPSKVPLANEGSATNLILVASRGHKAVEPIRSAAMEASTHTTKMEVPTGKSLENTFLKICWGVKNSQGRKEEEEKEEEK